MSSSIKLTNSSGKIVTITNPDTTSADVAVDLLNNAYTIATVDDFGTVPVGYTTVIVKDTDSGGIFVWSASGTANGGTVFAGSSGYWVRQYDGAVNVKWFGAVGDGVADDTTAIQAALNAGALKSVYVPPGNYKLTSPVTILSGTCLYGEGPTSRLFGSGTNDLIRTSWPASDITISDLQLDGMKTSGTAYVVVCFYVPASLGSPSTTNNNITVERCLIKQASAGVGFENTKNVQVMGCTVSHMYRHTSGAYAGVYGYGVVLNGCTRALVQNNVIGVSDGLIQRHGVYMPVFRDKDVSPTVLVYTNETRISNNTIFVNRDSVSEPYSSCIEAWNYFDIQITSNMLIGGVRGINVAPEYQNGSRVQIVGNTIKDNEICIRNGPATYNTGTYFDEYLIANNQLLPITSVAHQCVKLQGVKKIVFTGNYCRGFASSTFAFGYYDTVENIVADSVVSANNVIDGFTQGFYLANITKFVDSETVFQNFTSTPAPYVRNSAISSSNMRPVFSPYAELHQYSGVNWEGVSYFSTQFGCEIKYNSAWINSSGILVRGATASRPNKASNGNDADPLTLNLPYGFKYYDTGVGGLIYWNGACWYTSQQPAPPAAGTTTALNSFKASYPNALLAYNITSWNTTTSKPVFYNYLTNNWVYADGTAI